MHTLGVTRSAHRHNHLLQTPDTFVRTPLPCLRGGLAIVHIAPAGGSAFLQYTAEFDKAGELAANSLERFLFCLAGSLQLTAGEAQHTLVAGGYAHVPAHVEHAFFALEPSRAAVIERRYLAEPGAASVPKQVFVGHEDAVPDTGDLVGGRC